LEYWSDVKKRVLFSALQHSITPVHQNRHLKRAQASQYYLFILRYLIKTYNAESDLSIKSIRPARGLKKEVLAALMPEHLFGSFKK